MSLLEAAADVEGLSEVFEEAADASAPAFVSPNAAAALSCRCWSSDEVETEAIALSSDDVAFVGGRERASATTLLFP